MNSQLKSESQLSCIACGNGSRFETLCQSPDFRYQKGGLFSVLRCKECDLVLTYPRLQWSDLEAHYPDDYYNDRVTDHQLNQHPGRATHPLAPLTEINDLISDLKPGQLLEVGCGTGETLAYWEQRGWTCTGIEPSATAAEIATDEYGLNVFQGRFEEFDVNDGDYDLVLFDNVLEHLHDPFTAIERAHDLLQGDGKLVVEVPNIESIGFKLFSQYWSDLDVPRHLFHFSPETLIRETEVRGFKYEKLSFSGYPITFRYSLNRYLSERFSFSLGRWVGVTMLPVTLLSRATGRGDRFRVRFTNKLTR